MKRAASQSVAYQGERVGAWLGWQALTGLTVLCLFMGWTVWLALGEDASLETNARAQFLNKRLGQRVQQALEIGVPLKKLEGVEALFAQQTVDFPELQALALTDPQGRILWRYTAPTGAVSDAGKLTTTPVFNQGELAALIVLTLDPPRLGEIAMRWPPTLLLCVLLALLISTEAARFDLAVGPGNRIRLLRLASFAAAAGDFSLKLPRVRRRGFDSRPQWLSSQVRQLNERYLHVTRLIQSLRRTEPDPVRRTALDHILDQARAQDAFADGVRSEFIFSDVAQRATVRWLTLGLGWTVWQLATLWMMLSGVADLSELNWALWGLPTAMAVYVVVRAMTTRSRQRRHTRSVAVEDGWVRTGLVLGFALLLAESMLSEVVPGVARWSAAMSVLTVLAWAGWSRIRHNEYGESAETVS